MDGTVELSVLAATPRKEEEVRKGMMDGEEGGEVGCRGHGRNSGQKSKSPDGRAG